MLYLILLGATLILSGSAQGDSPRRVSVTGYIGCHPRTFPAVELTRPVKLDIIGRADYIAIVEVYPDTADRVRYRYEVVVDGFRAARRYCVGGGFGPVTWFVRVPGSRAQRVELRRLPGGDTPLIASVRAVSRAYLDALLAEDSFRIMGLAPPAATSADAASLAEQIAANLPEEKAKRISRGFAYEVRYANSPPQRVRQQIEDCALWSKKHKMPAMLGLVSWWSGTPLAVEDGLGGHFEDLKYQQVCYSPDDVVAENPELAKLVGERYNRHYGLSVPNQWSNVPWLTMNSETLNAYRFRRIGEAIAIAADIGGADHSWIDSIYLENEPRYWDTDCEAGNPKSDRKVVWADFNPMVIEDARRDGTDLNPNDGLSTEELAWLHRNVGRYNQDTVDSAGAALARSGLADLPVYTHSLQHRQMFPGGSINHPASEWAYAEGARSGIEGMWCQPADFYRVREWGRWANVNREENDGRHIDEHLWDLRVAYMMGADLYNSYNWHAIGAQRFFDYVNEFVALLPVVSLPPAACEIAGPVSLKLRTPMKLQAFSRLSVRLEAPRGFRGWTMLTAGADDGNVVESGRVWANLPAGNHVVEYEFTCPVESRSNRDCFLTLTSTAASSSAGRQLRLAADSSSSVVLSLDLRTQRALSLAVISPPNPRPRARTSVQ